MNEINLKSVKTKVTIKRLKVKDYVEVLDIFGEFFSNRPSLIGDLSSGDEGKILSTMLVVVVQAYEKVKKIVSIVTTSDVDIDVDSLEIEELVDLLVFIYKESDILNKFESVKKKMGQINPKIKK